MKHAAAAIQELVNDGIITGEAAQRLVSAVERDREDQMKVDALSLSPAELTDLRACLTMAAPRDWTPFGPLADVAQTLHTKLGRARRLPMRSNVA